MRPKVVLDTNLVVSAHLNEEGHEASVLALALVGKLHLYTSQPILAEYEGVLRREKFRLDPHRVRQSLDLIRAETRVVKPSHRLSVATDSDDDKFLECAEIAAADFLVTGNKRHFPKQWKTTQVVNARQLIEMITASRRR